MPTTSEKQHRAMEAAAHGHSTLGIPQSVGEEFVKADSAESPIAAGILFLTDDGKTLLLKRGEGGDYPGFWGLPAGHIEPDETPEQAARRETLEETGLDYTGELSEAMSAGGFVTYVAKIAEPFPVKMCDESSGAMWSYLDDLPYPLHPGIRDALDIATMRTELDAARLVMRGVLPSGFKFLNVYLFDMRITGTGTAWRVADNELAYRPPEFYMNEEFLQRCNGLPVVWQHPEGDNLALIKPEEYAAQNIGSVFLPYLKHDEQEVWGVAKIYDDEKAEIMLKKQMSTSPGVLVAPILKQGDNESGQLYIEGNPRLIDHLAVCEQGVWDKGGDPAGVTLSQTGVNEMSDEVKKDSAPGVNAPTADLSALLTAINKIAEDNAQIKARLDSAEEKARSDSEAEAKAKQDAEEAEAKAKQDAEEAEAKAKKDAEEAAARLAADSAEEMNMKADYCAKMDSVLSAVGKRASQPLPGERAADYRLRALMTAQKFASAELQSLDLQNIRHDSAMLAMAESNILQSVRANATKTARTANNLVEVVKRVGGREIREFVGSTKAFLAPFVLPAQRVMRINKPGAK
jgi:hypothetical protein